MNSARFKVVLAGNENVGKSSLVRRFVDNQFSESYLPTLGFQLFFKSMKVGDYMVEFQVWDVAGQKSYEFLRRNYYVHAQGFLVVFDLTRRTSFENLEQWIAEVRAICPRVPAILIGNKVDLPNAEISEDEFLQKSGQLGVSGRVLTSAKTGSMVKDAFDLLGRAMLTHLDSKSPVIY